MWKTIGNWIGGGVTSLLVYLAYENWSASQPNISWQAIATDLATNPVAQMAVAPMALMTVLVVIYIRKFGFGIDQITPLGKLIWFGIGVGTLLPLSIHSALGTADAALDTLKDGSILFAMILVIASWLMLKRTVRVLRDGEFDPPPKWPSKKVAGSA